MADTDNMLGMGGVGLLVILFFLMSGGFGGFGGYNRGDFATSAEVQRGFDAQNSMANQRETLGAVTSRTAQAVAATNQTFHDLLGVIDQRYNETTRDIGSLQAAIAQAIANQNDCCCSTKLLLTEQNALTNANIAAGINSIREKLDANKIEELQAKVADLAMDKKLCGVVRYPTNACWAWQGGPIMGAPVPPFAPIA